MARGGDQDRKEPFVQIVRAARRGNVIAIAKLLLIVGLYASPVWIVWSIATSTPYLTDRQRQALHAYRTTPQWRLMAYPPRSVDTPLVVEQSLDEAGCVYLRNLYLRKALDQGSALPDVRCEDMHPWWTRAYMESLALLEKWEKKR